MSFYPQVIYPTSFESLGNRQPSIKEIFGKEAPIQKHTSPMLYLGVLFTSYIIGVVASAIISALAIHIIIPIYNAFSKPEQYSLNEYFFNIIAIIIGLICAFFGLLLIARDDTRATKDYKVELEEYSRLQVECKDKTNLLDFKHKELINLIEYYNITSTTSSATLGVSEAQFLRYLNKNSNVQGKFEHGNALNFGIKSSLEDILYTPDIIYTDSILGFKIDIEIDEPYVGSSRQPIHFIDENGESKDRFRNEIFTMHNWTIIRFSEEQVIKHPRECLEYIINIIQQIKLVSFEIPLSSLSEKPKWSKQEASLMAINNFRESYLNIKFAPAKDFDSNLPF